MKKKIILIFLTLFTLFGVTAEEAKRTVEEISYDILRYPNSAALYIERTNAYIALKRYSEALSDATMVIALAPSATTIAARGVLYLDIEMFQNAIHDLNRAIEIDPANTFYYHKRGQAYLLLEEYQKAIVDISKAIDLDPKNAEAYTNRGSCYVQIDQYQKGLNDLNIAITLDSNDAESFYWRGGAYNGLGETDKAIHDFTRAIVIMPDYANAFFTRSLTYFNMGKYQEAISDLMEFNKLSPTANAYKGLGRAYQALADQEKNRAKKADYQRKADENFAIMEKMGETR